MNIEDQYTRYPNGISEKKLSNRLGLYWEESIQDWEFIVADSERLSDFLKIYQTELDNDNDKFTLMSLIVSSFDDGFSEEDIEIKELWEVCRIILEKECFLHFSIIKYWSLLEEKDAKNIFSITPYIRKVWDKVEMNFF
ncbi:hypothetical protein D1816_14020 [Aquimarina sp. AD10]|uniref:hypothetical protein n=1 Tax=Aquimarina sp. AD10 TaxID=1714849 RepID=UPI000E4BCEB8|nr:hypothetical protein [Aquimarina sp. AD10]AXT61418.1 hypothetical protein D1816_14020 [Aquimarina sp. AD10]RKM89903.1 hypothetical protein D7033_24540 [Aquimarina sp. AD10]